MKWALATFCLLTVAVACLLGGLQRAAHERRIERLERNMVVVSNVIEGLIEVAHGQEANQFNLATNIAKVLAREIVERRKE